MHSPRRGCERGRVRANGQSGPARDPIARDGHQARTAAHPPRADLQVITLLFGGSDQVVYLYVGYGLYIAPIGQANGEEATGN